MVHVKKCPYEDGRGKPTTEFYIDKKPQIYCLGWIDRMNDEPLEICKNCKDWAWGEQCAIDFEEAKRKDIYEIINGFLSIESKTRLKDALKNGVPDNENLQKEKECNR